MRMITILISFYFVLIAVLPCQDKDDVISGTSSMTSITRSLSTSDEVHQDVCPPFCNCSCCSTPRTIPAQEILMLYPETLLGSFPQSRIPSTQQQAIKIWQPPQSA